MTSEIRTTIQLSDLKAIEFECRECHCRTVRPMGGIQSLLLCCPECGATWANFRGTLEFLSKTVSQIPKAAAIDSPESPFVVRFEIAMERNP
ncbi:hypothetical protein SBA7_1310007 [Candidatus Sulfotelmatobacter sp. SbA7]|nr:hypothetical protein SBA7_1310007 [Candidatus Sulfotelmatobacter sp. SbA7]